MSGQWKKKILLRMPRQHYLNSTGYHILVTTWQIKHGLNTETHAKTKYKTITKKHTKDMIFTDP